MSAHTETTDVVIRFHAPARLIELERAVFSVVAQNAQPTVVHVVTQRFGEDAIAATRGRLQPLFETQPNSRLEIHNWRAATPLDARSCLINEGIRHASGRYLSFLDYDDVLFPEAHEILRERLNITGAAIAFASVQTMRVTVHETFVKTVGREIAPFKGSTLFDLMRENLAPIHSYLIDRSRAPLEELHFDETLAWEEDYEFLLRLCARAKADFAKVGTFVGYYNFKTDGSNSVPTTPQAARERSEAYARVRAEIARRKAGIALSPETLKQLKHLAPAPLTAGVPVTVADVAGW
ncbi:glycosyltransferase family A protein [Variovorax saccharolyticus]|uniref:glycosyltransferase family A protein n=1 Tax=Variovorax saccharolyticus TaxID=3053516 RepID=UPI002575A278|nr:glycosyltransferase family 2 protein [Variovorax sp. J22R187]MDM0017559.1 glycosyltransferase family 2 protein [Variovorax sp. J22R187]